MLSPEEAERFYDRFGSRQDGQAFYEDPATHELVAGARFGMAHRIIEAGCGTGRFAATLLRDRLPRDAQYFALDLSRTMTRLAAERLRPWAARACVLRGDVSVGLPFRDGSADRVVANYLLDLLPEEVIESFLTETLRVLRAEGVLCLVGLTEGRTALSAGVSRLWSLVHRVRPAWVGGCRPLNMGEWLRERSWNLACHRTVVAWGVPSEVIIAEPPHGGVGSRP